MSADLLEAFGAHTISASAPEESRHAKKLTSLASNAVRPRVSDITPNPLWRKDTSGTDVLFDAVDDVDDGDDFGDFEDPEPGLQKQQQYSEQPQKPAVNTDSATLLDLESSPVTVKRTATESQRELTGAHDGDPFGSILDSANGTVSKAQQADRESHDKEFEDDWGTFEDAELTSTTTETRAERPIQNIHSSEPLQGAMEEDNWAIFHNEPTTKQSRATYPAVAQQSYAASDDVEEDEWDAFEDGPAPEPSVAAKSLRSHPPTDTIQPLSISSTKSTSPKRHDRPTNVPPPSILLELLPKIYQNLATKSRSASTSSHSDEIVTAAHHILRVFLTTARILAGRPHRWKRDPHLSQSIRISAAGSKGMKLQTLDRSHVVKEDQDAIEAITVWSRYAHAFNSTLLKARIPRPTSSTNLSGNMPVRTANGPGVLTAKEVCAVCGLKRNERITGIDTNVDDVFGEFWVEFWGHRDCCAFWEEAEGMLEQR